MINNTMNFWKSDFFGFSFTRSYFFINILMHVFMLTFSGKYICLLVVHKSQPGMPPIDMNQFEEAIKKVNFFNHFFFNILFILINLLPTHLFT